MVVSANPNLIGRSTTGMTLPRRFITPRTTGGIDGREVIRSLSTISRTYSICSAYSSPMRLKVTNCRIAGDGDIGDSEGLELGVPGRCRGGLRGRGDPVAVEPVPAGRPHHVG